MTLKQYLEINKLPSKEGIEYLCGLYSILKNEPLDKVYELNMSDINNYLKTQDLKISDKYKNTINIGGKNFYKKDINYLSVGEFVDILNYIKKDDTLSIIKVLYRLRNDDTMFNKVEYEEYGDFSNRNNLFLNNININDVFGAVKEIKINVKKVFKAFPRLFNTYNDDNTNYHLLSDNKKEEYNRYKKEEEKDISTAWQKLIMFSIDDDLTKINDMLNMPILMFLNFYSIKLEKFEKEQSKLKTKRK